MPGVRIAAVFPAPPNRHIQHTDRIAVLPSNTVDPVSCRAAGIHKFLHGLFRIGLAFLPRVRANIQQVIRILQRPVLKERLQGPLPLRIRGIRIRGRDFIQRKFHFPVAFHRADNFLHDP